MYITKFTLNRRTNCDDSKISDRFVVYFVAVASWLSRAGLHSPKIRPWFCSDLGIYLAGIHIFFYADRYICIFFGFRR
jgi:hypothetical protein